MLLCYHSSKGYWIAQWLIFVWEDETVSLSCTVYTLYPYIRNSKSPLILYTRMKSINHISQNGPVYMYYNCRVLVYIKLDQEWLVVMTLNCVPRHFFNRKVDEMMTYRNKNKFLIKLDNLFHENKLFSWKYDIRPKKKSILAEHIKIHQNIFNVSGIAKSEWPIPIK